MHLRPCTGLQFYNHTKQLIIYFFYKIKRVTPDSFVDLFLNTFLLIIRHLLVNLFLTTICRILKMRKFTTPTGIVLVIVHYTINSSK